MSHESARRGDRCVVVTGGSSGVGAAFARAAAAHGWSVWLGYAGGRDRAQRLASECAGGGTTVSPIHLPLHDLETLRTSLAHIAETGPAPTAAVLCGAPPPELLSLTKLGATEFRRHHECAVIGNHALLVELWLRFFRAAGGGHVAAVLSAAQGPRPTPHMAAYVTAKAGLEQLLHAALAEWGAGGLRASALRPGFVDTPMMDVFSPHLVERALATSGRPVQPEAVARAILQALERPPAPGTLDEVPLRAAVDERVL